MSPAFCGTPFSLFLILDIRPRSATAVPRRCGFKNRVASRTAPQRLNAINTRLGLMTDRQTRHDNSPYEYRLARRSDGRATEITEAAEITEFTTKERSKRGRTEEGAPQPPGVLIAVMPDGGGHLILRSSPFTPFLRCELRYLRCLRNPLSCFVCVCAWPETEHARSSHCACLVCPHSAAKKRAAVLRNGTAHAK